RRADSRRIMTLATTTIDHFSRCTVSVLSNSTLSVFFFFFNDTAPTEIYTLSLHDALPIFSPVSGRVKVTAAAAMGWPLGSRTRRSEEHTSELQSRENLVCRLLLEKKKKKKITNTHSQELNHNSQNTS